ncbi:MAG: hypothetical protein RLN81_03490 [Balneolaceae bacterium]
MNKKLLSAALILTSLVGYLEWGQDNSIFLFQAEYDILLKLFTDPKSVFHPFTVLPLFGQILLAITLFQKEPGKKLTFFGIGGIGILLLLMFAIGIMGMNFKVLVSTLPFLTVAFFAIRLHLKKEA